MLIQYPSATLPWKKCRKLTLAKFILNYTISCLADNTFAMWSIAVVEFHFTNFKQSLCLFEIERELTFLFQFRPSLSAEPFTHGRSHLKDKAALQTKTKREKWQTKREKRRTKRGTTKGEKKVKESKRQRIKRQGEKKTKKYKYNRKK